MGDATRLVAVDVGTTSTAAAVVRGGVVRPVHLGDDTPVLATRVAATADGTLVGAAVDVEDAAAGFLHDVGQVLPVAVAGRRAHAHELVAAQVAAAVERVAGRDARATDVVVVVPGSWGPSRSGLVQAAVAEWCTHEPTVVAAPAAAAHVGTADVVVRRGALVGVLDLGGDAAVASVLRRDRDTFGLAGLPVAEPGGGGGLEALLVDLVAARVGWLGDRSGVPAADAARLQDATRAAVAELAHHDRATAAVVLPDGSRRTAVLTHRHLRMVLGPSLHRAAAALERALAAAGLALGDLARVVLVGGAAALPCAAELVEGRLEVTVHVPEPSVAAVAAGAALATVRGHARYEPTWWRPPSAEPATPVRLAPRPADVAVAAPAPADDLVVVAGVDGLPAPVGVDELLVLDDAATPARVPAPVDDLAVVAAVDAGAPSARARSRVTDLVVVGGPAVPPPVPSTADVLLDVAAAPEPVVRVDGPAPASGPAARVDVPAAVSPPAAVVDVTADAQPPVAGTDVARRPAAAVSVLAAVTAEPPSARARARAVAGRTGRLVTTVAAVVLTAAFAVGVATRGPDDAGLDEVVVADPAAPATADVLASVGPVAAVRGDEVVVLDADAVRSVSGDVAAPADPAVSPDGTVVLFTGGDDGRQLYEAPVDGSAPPRAVAAGPGSVHDPAWSPDGGRIAFSLQLGPVRTLRVLDVATGGLVDLTFGQVDDRAPAWSPDGSRLAVQRRTSSADGTVRDEVLVLPSDASAPPTPLVDGDGPSRAAPTWSPDGTRLAVTTGTGDDVEVELVDVATGRAAALPGGVGAGLTAPTWAPSGVLLATLPADPDQLVAIDPDAGGFLPLGSGAAPSVAATPPPAGP